MGLRVFLLMTGLLVGNGGVALAQDEAQDEAQDAPAPIEPEGEGIDAQARQLFADGRAAYVEGRFETALRAFRASYELSGRSELLFNVGTTLDRLRRSEEAVEYFERYLEETEGASNRAEVEARIRALQREIDEQREHARDQEVLTAELRAEREARLRAEAEDDSLFEKWWFWTIVGSVVVAAVITAVIVFPIETRQSPDVGSTGLVTTTLSWP